MSAVSHTQYVEGKLTYAPSWSTMSSIDGAILKLTLAWAAWVSVSWEGHHPEQAGSEPAAGASFALGVETATQSPFHPRLPSPDTGGTMTLFLDVCFGCGSSLR